MSSEDLVVVKNQKLFHETDAAILIGPPHLPTRARNGKTWIPIAFVNSPYPFNEIGDVADVELPRWVAEQRDLDYEE